MTDLEPGHLSEARTVDFEEFLSTEREEVFEYVHVIFAPDEGKVALYRTVGDIRGEMLRHDIDARLSFIQSDRIPAGLHLSAGEADTLLTFLDRLRVERSPATVCIDYMETNNSPMIEESEFDCETVVFEYRTESGRSNRIEMDGLYKNDQHMMGKFA